MKTAERAASKVVTGERVEKWIAKIEIYRFDLISDMNRMELKAFVRLMLIDLAHDFNRHPSTDNWALLNHAMTIRQQLINPTENKFIVDMIIEPRF